MEDKVITVATTEKNQYGDLVVTDTLGKEYKMKKRLVDLFPLFQQGTALVLTMKEYKGFPYVDGAKLFDGKPPSEKQVSEITAGVEKTPPIFPETKPSNDMSKEDWAVKNRTERGSIEAQTAVKAILQHENPTGEVAARVYLKALSWCEAKIDVNMPEVVFIETEPIAFIPPEPIDMDWVKESLKKVKWTEKTAVSFFDKFNIEKGTLKEMLSRATKEQLGEFVKEIEDRLEMA